MAGLGGTFADTVLTGSLIAALPVALIAGLVSFVSPCVVPLVPGYLGYLSSMAGAGAGPGGRGSRSRLVLGVLLFVLGFASVFVVLGVGFASLGSRVDEQLDLITRILGVLVVVMGFVFLGSVPFMQRERRIHVSPKAGLWGAPLLGIVFGLGWTPCIGPTLAAVLTLSLSEATATRGVVLAVAYSLGLGLPFIALAVWMERSRSVLGWLRRHRLALMRIGGGMLIVLGLLLVTGLWSWLTGQMQGWIDGFWVSV
ncbi:cytochrome c biogenesis protein CcdA [Demequina sp. TTPB684]|nr:cytochrome c biogenesis protein CcdA [Demequina sp. TMPB413]MCB2411412.1 cytochrome c biogenesis protein CcdA [Demequina sp. TTPB684]UPU89771.1 cytochrome c biogenesis protein CcdA [Demequina sp. TMPB413]